MIRRRSTAWTIVKVATALATIGWSLAAGATTFEAGGSVYGDFNLGADKLAVLQFTDQTSQDIKAGNGLMLQAGAGALFIDGSEHHIETTLSLGLKYSTMRPAENANLSFLRVPIELLAFYRNEALHFRIGGGPACYVFNSLSGSGAASNLDVKFKPAVGGIIEADAVVKDFFFGLRYTILKLHPNDSDASFSANSLGVGIGYFHQFRAP